MPDRRFCRRERAEYPALAFTRAGDGRFIHEIVGDRHYTDGEQWYAPDDPCGRVDAPAPADARREIDPWE